MYRALLYLAASGVLVAQNAPSPMLSYSTCLRGGFAPLALTADTAGNVYLAGSVMPDPFTFADSGGIASGADADSRGDCLGSGVVGCE
ncbi:MAG TPA: hypothetical protein VGZ73_00215 [Bryobacteraceae bacterium]|jgi:hypothetical protein|nr:hypothetical protein [Bryobacteraceae bacterium]